MNQKPVIRLSLCFLLSLLPRFRTHCGLWLLGKDAFGNNSPGQIAPSLWVPKHSYQMAQLMLQWLYSTSFYWFRIRVKKIRVCCLCVYTIETSFACTHSPFGLPVYIVLFPHTSCCHSWPSAQMILKDVDSLLYVDTDVLFLRPIDDLWGFLRVFNSTQLAAMAPEHEIPKIGWYSRFARHPYYGMTGINSGVMLMNLTRIRNAQFKVRIRARDWFLGLLLLALKAHFTSWILIQVSFRYWKKLLGDHQSPKKCGWPPIVLLLKLAHNLLHKFGLQICHFKFIA